MTELAERPRDTAREAAVHEAPPEDAKAAPWVSVLAMVAMLLAIGGPIIGIGVFHGADMIMDYAPWAYEAPAGFEPNNPPVGDTVNAAMPMRAQLRERVLDGELPLWSRDPGSGTPLLSVPDLSPMSPLFLPYYVLPLWFAPAVSKLLELVVAATFTALFVRRLGTSRVAALSAGLIFAFSGFQVVWTNWPQTTVGAFIPMLFWGVERTIQERTIRSSLPVALAVAFMLFGGFPAVTGFALLAAGVYAVARALSLREQPLRHRTILLGGLGVMVVLGLAVAAVQVLPFLENLARLDNSHRVQNPRGHLPLEALATTFFPLIFGPAADGAYWGPKNVVEINSFVGVVALVLIGFAAAIPGRRTTPSGVRATLWALIAVSVVLIYVGGSLLGIFQEALPFLFGTNAVGRMRSVLGLLLAVMAGLGFDALLARGGGKLTRRELAVGAVIVAGALFLVYRALDFILEQPTVAGTPQLEQLHRIAPLAALSVLAGAVVVTLSIVARKKRLRISILATLAAAGLGVAAVLWTGSSSAAEVTAARNSAAPLLAALGLGLLLGFYLRTGQRRLLLFGVPLLIAIEVVGFAHPYWARSSREHFYPTTETHQFLAVELEGARIAMADRTMQPGTTTFYGLPALTAHIFFDPEWQDLVSAADPRAFEKPTFPKLHVPREDLAMVPTHPVLDRLAVRYFAVDPSLPIFGVRQELIESPGTVELSTENPILLSLGTNHVWGVRVRLSEAFEGEDDARAWLHADLLDGDGSVLQTGSRRIESLKAPKDVTLPVADTRAGEGDELRVRLRLQTDRGGGTVGLMGDGQPALGHVEPSNEGVTPVWARGAVIYEQDGWLPRIRWASTTEVITEAVPRLARLSSDELPDETVVLSAPGPEASGAPAALEVVEDTGDALRIQIDAEGSGYVVIADGLQHGWEAQLDGRPTLLRHADHALVAVAVPEGEHELVLEYAPKSLSVGAWISGLALAALGGLVLVTRKNRNRSPHGGT